MTRIFVSAAAFAALCLVVFVHPDGACAASGQLVISVSHRFAGQIATIDDPSGKGAILISASGVTVELDDYQLQSTEADTSKMTGIGVYGKGLRDVTIRGGRIAGYKWGIFLEDCENVTIEDVSVESSRMQHLFSTPQAYDTRDWLDQWSIAGFEQYGGAIYLKGCSNCTVARISAEYQQNGVTLTNCRNVTVEDCALSNNSGWGIHLWNSDNCRIRRNIADYCQRLEFWQYSAGGDSAGMLVGYDSCFNTIEDNSFSNGGDGFFLCGQRPWLRPSNFNIVRRNDCTGSPHNGIEATFSRGNRFIENDVSDSRYGFWLGYSYETLVEGNRIEGVIEDGIAIEHGHGNVISNNTLSDSPVGIRIFCRVMPDWIGNDPSSDYTITGNMLYKHKYGIIVSETSKATVTGNTLEKCRTPISVDDKSSEVSQDGNSIR